MFSKLQLNEAVRIGPWRVARKHLMFILIFCLLIVICGTIVLESHVFESSADDDDDDDDEEGDDDWPEFGDGISSGDWVMIAIMVLAGSIAIVSAVSCFIAKSGTPDHLPSPSGASSVYTVQYSGDTKGNINPIPRASYSAPQPAAIWTGDVLQSSPQTQQQPVQFQNLDANNSNMQQTQPQVRNQRTRKHGEQIQQINTQYLQQQQTRSQQADEVQNQPIQYQIQLPYLAPQPQQQQQQQQQQQRQRDHQKQKPRSQRKPSDPTQLSQTEMPPPYSP